MPVEPAASPWLFADPRPVDDDLVALGADLAPGTILAAYRRGLFPMPCGASFCRHSQTGWWCPVRRGVLPLERLRVSRSLRQSVRRFEIRVDTCFDQVLQGCADPARDGGWIDEPTAAAYTDLHRLGWAHSVEAWRDGQLAGGLYGVAIGGLFAGESMFHRERDASKVALVGLVDLLTDTYAQRRLIDVQWSTPHLASLGVVEIDREDYLGRLDAALGVPLPEPWREPTGW